MDAVNEFRRLKMLIGDRAKYIGIVIGLTFASLLITQQSAIFVGVMARAFSFLTDTVCRTSGWSILRFSILRISSL